MTPDVSGLAVRLKAENFQVVFFQKVFGDSVLTLARELRKLGIKTVFSICDFINPAMCEATDMTIVVTDHLKSLYPKELQAKVTVVHDGIEKPMLHKTEWGGHAGSRQEPIKAVLVTSTELDKIPLLVSPPEWLRITIVGSYSADDNKLRRLRDHQWRLRNIGPLGQKLDYMRFLANPRIRCHAWGPESVYAEMQQADIGIIPIEPDTVRDPTGAWKLKSENRLTLKMAMALPVVATPIPSYEPVIDHGKNGFLARTPSEWLKYLSALRDPQLRQHVGQLARQRALAGYSMDLQAQRLITALQNLIGYHSTTS
ncbi:glycosyltransferase [Rhodoferax sp.]|uniref:glycosyltransferase n=1 Tax=Rhodoferax sp. TaxID=50421 RepID=UPI00283FF54E|nr:glycosyltransferase [Rhodoferax sp.]MDR3368497.1 glycosyltransferase [Rhodoferax sp.]